MARHRSRRPSWIKGLLIGVACVIAGVLITISLYSLYLILTESPEHAEPTVNQPLIGRVKSVDSPSSLTVTTPNGDIKVRVIGIADPPECGLSVANEFARDELNEELVSLVPDLSVPRFDSTNQFYYHVVLRTQMSYSDAALMSGNAIVAGYNSWYRDVYVREQSEAQDREDGVWGSPCNLPTR